LKIAGDDGTKFEEASKLNFIFCLNLLSYWKERDELELQINKQIKQNKPY